MTMSPASGSLAGFSVAAGISRPNSLSLQLALYFVEKAPIGAVGDDLIGRRLDHAGLVQPQRIKPHGVSAVIVAPFAVRDLAHRAQGVVVIVVGLAVEHAAGRPLRIAGAD